VQPNNFGSAYGEAEPTPHIRRQSRDYAKFKFGWAMLHNRKLTTPQIILDGLESTLAYFPLLDLLSRINGDSACPLS
jgi:hypothetical protein